jgi:hypothetical protein
MRSSRAKLSQARTHDARCCHAVPPVQPKAALSLRSNSVREADVAGQTRTPRTVCAVNASRLCSSKVAFSSAKQHRRARMTNSSTALFQRSFPGHANDDPSKQHAADHAAKLRSPKRSSVGMTTHGPHLTSLPVSPAVHPSGSTFHPAKCLGRISNQTPMMQRRCFACCIPGLRGGTANENLISDLLTQIHWLEDANGTTAAPSEPADS